MKNQLLVLLSAVSVLIISVAISNQRYLEEQKSTNETLQLSVEMSEYVDAELGYRASFPKDLKIERYSEYSVLMLAQTLQDSAAPSNYMYFSVIPPGSRLIDKEIYAYNQRHFETLSSLDSLGDSVSLETEGVDPAFTNYKFVSTVEIDGIAAKLFENSQPNEFLDGMVENRFVFEKNGYLYVLGYVTGGDPKIAAQIDPRVAFKSITSFKTN